MNGKRGDNDNETPPDFDHEEVKKEIEKERESTPKKDFDDKWGVPGADPDNGYKGW